MNRFKMLSLILLIPLLLTAPLATIAEEASPPQPGISLIDKSERELVFEIHTPVYELNPLDSGPANAHRLIVPGYQTYREAGAPELPFAGTQIQLPDQGDYQVEVLSTESEPLPGSYYLQPAPSPVPLEEDLTPGQTERRENPEIYNTSAPFPKTPARLGEDAWFRNHRFAPLQVFPFQYNPQQNSLIWHKTITVRVTFSADLAAKPSASPLDAMFANTAVSPSPVQGADSSLPMPMSMSQSEPTLSGPAYKISVDQDGMYRITYDDLDGIMADIDTINPQNFKLTSQGQEVAIYVAGEDDSSFDPQDYILFYGEKLRGDRLASLYEESMQEWNSVCFVCKTKDFFPKYTDENVYWLTFEDFPLRMSTVDGTPDGSTVPTYYMETVRAEESHFWYTHHWSSADTWFWEFILDEDTRYYPVNLNSIATPTGINATVTGEIVSEYNSDHSTHIYLNSKSNPVAEETWSGVGDYDFSNQVSPTILLEGENQLLFEAEFVGQHSTDKLYFNWFEVEYPRQFVAQNDRLIFERDEAGSPWEYQVTGFTSAGVDSFDISNPRGPIKITGSTFEIINPGTESETGKVTFSAQHSSDTKYALVGTDSYLSPVGLEYVDPPDFASLPKADYIFITHADFSSALQPLVNYREGQGLSTLTVDIEDLYNSFNYGIYHTIAIKNFLSYTFQHWDPPPSYALLVGYGHWNLKGYEMQELGPDLKPQPYGDGVPDPIYIPPNLAFVDPWQGEVDSTNLLATLVGDDLIPDLAIGRLPVTSASELTAVINKITAYEQADRQSWHRNLLQVSDDIPDSAGDFVATMEGFISDYLDLVPVDTERVYLNDICPGDPPSCPAMNTEIINSLNNEGALMMTFIGHGSVQKWTREGIFKYDNLSSLTNLDQLPVVLSLDCLDGYWPYPEQTSLMDAMVRLGNGGSVAAFAPTGLGVSTGHDTLAQGFYEELFTNKNRDLGEVSLASKLALHNSQNNFDLLNTYLILGDPALQIQLPEPTKAADFLGDGSTDVSVYRPSLGNWYVHGTGSVPWGRAGDLPVAGDYDGDGQIDHGVFRPSNGKWYLKDIGNITWGYADDVPMPCDYDGDGDTDIAVYRPSNGNWYIKGIGSISWGFTGDVPVPGDYDGDSTCDVAVFRPSNGRWYVMGQSPTKWAADGDIPIPADYDGDGTTDIAVYRPSNGNWYIMGMGSTSWGITDDIPVPGDYDGDGDYDIAVLRPSNGKWYIKDQGIVKWYQSGDFPLPVRDTNGNGEAYGIP